MHGSHGSTALATQCQISFLVLSLSVSSFVLEICMASSDKGSFPWKKWPRSLSWSRRRKQRKHAVLHTHWTTQHHGHVTMTLHCISLRSAVFAVGGGVVQERWGRGRRSARSPFSAVADTKVSEPGRWVCTGSFCLALPSFAGHRYFSHKLR